MSDIDSVIGYQHQLQSKAARGAPLPWDIDPGDPASWPYSDRNAMTYDDDAASWPERRGYSADPLSTADLTVGPREVICTQCHLVHRPEQECP